MKRVEVFVAEGDADRFLGMLEYDELRGKEVSSFELDDDFVRRPSIAYLGPDIGLFRGKQYPALACGFGMFQDAAPDSWGRKIIRRPRPGGAGAEILQSRHDVSVPPLRSIRFAPHTVRLRDDDAWLQRSAGGRQRHLH